MDIPGPLEWHIVLAKDVDQGKSNQALSKEEQLRRERQRAAAFGLSTYTYHDGYALMIYTLYRLHGALIAFLTSESANFCSRLPTRSTLSTETTYGDTDRF
jgi:hypothetical protein